MGRFGIGFAGIGGLAWPCSQNLSDCMLCNCIETGQLHGSKIAAYQRLDDFIENLQSENLSASSQPSSVSVSILCNSNVCRHRQNCDYFHLRKLVSHCRFWGLCAGCDF